MNAPKSPQRTLRIFLNEESQWRWCHVWFEIKGDLEKSSIPRMCFDTCRRFLQPPFTTTTSRVICPSTHSLGPQPGFCLQHWERMLTHKPLATPLQWTSITLVQSPNRLLESPAVYKCLQQHIDHRQYSPLSIKIFVHSFPTPISFPPPHPLFCLLAMKTHTKNKSKHPAAPIMTPRQLEAAGITQLLK